MDLVFFSFLVSPLAPDVLQSFSSGGSSSRVKVLSWFQSHICEGLELSSGVVQEPGALIGHIRNNSKQSVYLLVTGIEGVHICFNMLNQNVRNVYRHLYCSLLHRLLYN